MSRASRLVAAASAVAAVVGGVAAGPAMAQAAPGGRTVLTGSVPGFAAAAKPVGSVPGSDRLTVQLWLAPDSAAAAAYATAVSTPGNARFHDYLSPGGYTARFGASAAAAGQVESWLRGQGFSGVGTDAQRNYVRATAPVSAIDAAFSVRLRTYRSDGQLNAGRYTLRANDRAVSLPTSIAGRVLGVTGLDNAAPVIPLAGGGDATPASTASSSAPPCSHYYGQRMATGLPEKYGVTSFPTIVCGYSATQMRQAYGATGTDAGTGQTVALVEDGLTKDMFLTLQDYAQANGLPAPLSTRYEELSLGNDSCGDPFDLEEQLDVEAAHDMAPGASELVLGGDSCNNGDFGLQALTDADTKILDGASGHPLATVASNSWESGTESEPASWTNIQHAILVRSAAEGVGMYFSSGDGSGVLEPSIDPFAIAVGGTSLGIGQAGQRLFETGWSTGDSVIRNGKWVLTGEDGAAGGGPSTKWAQPSYQQGIVPSSMGTTRSAPDLSASADAFTGMALGLLRFPKGGGVKYYQIPIGGTSESSPLVAGMVTAAQQGQSAPFGFIDPAIYQLAGTDAFHDILPLTSSSPALYRGVQCAVKEFANICGKPPVQNLTTFDDQNPHMRFYTGQVTAPGYDNMTGLGSPNGANFTAALRRVAG